MPLTTIAAVRAAGVSDSVTDIQITTKIAEVDAIITRVCRQPFEPVSLDLTVDGTGNGTLLLPVPIITLTELYVNDSTTPLEASRYSVYNGNNAVRDDRRNPKVVLKRRGRFRCGSLNQRLVGTFGFVEPDGSIPLPIQRAATLLVLERLPEFGDLDDFDLTENPGTAQTGRVVEERTDGHLFRWSVTQFEPRKAQLSGITEDQRILEILWHYKSPIIGAYATRLA